MIKSHNQSLRVTTQVVTKQSRLVRSVFLGAALALFLAACKELPPPGLVLKDPETGVKLVDTCYTEPSFTPQEKVVLIEEFTGVKCVNCPQAHDDIDNIIAARPAGRVLSASIHNDHPLANPHAGEEDYETPEGTDISQLVGGSFNIPSGVIDRFDFDGDGEPIEGRTNWPVRVDAQLAKATPVNVTVSIKDYDAESRRLIAGVRLHFTQAVGAKHSISVMIIESGIIATQSLPPPQPADPAYVHNRVLRGMMTSSLGNLLTCDLTVGTVIEKDFVRVLGETWVPDGCEVIAFIHKSSGFDVLQAASVKVIP